MNTDYYQLAPYEIAPKDLEGIVHLLQDYNEQGRLVSYNFNGHMLYSDTVNMNSAFFLVTGKTKDQIDREAAERAERLRQLTKPPAPQAPKFDNEWVEKGRSALDIRYWKLWDDYADVIAQKPKAWKFFDAVLKIAKELNNNSPLADVLILLEEQGFTNQGERHALDFIEDLCDRGEAFGNYLKHSRSLDGRIESISRAQDSDHVSPWSRSNDAR